LPIHRHTHREALGAHSQTHGDRGEEEARLAVLKKICRSFFDLRAAKAYGQLSDRRRRPLHIPTCGAKMGLTPAGQGCQ